MALVVKRRNNNSDSPNSRSGRKPESPGSAASYSPELERRSKESGDSVSTVLAGEQQQQQQQEMPKVN